MLGIAELRAQSEFIESACAISELADREAFGGRSSLTRLAFVDSSQKCSDFGCFGRCRGEAEIRSDRSDFAFWTHNRYETSALAASARLDQADRRCAGATFRFRTGAFCCPADARRPATINRVASVM